jgi:hypothetical protein
MLRLAVAAGLTVLTLAAFVPATAHAAECPAVTVDGVRVVELTDEHGCDQGAKLASAGVMDGGYLQDDTYYCRWGQGGTRPVKREGKTFYAAFCMDKDTEAEATFLARPPLEICRDTGLDDLRARYVACSTAQSQGRCRPGRARPRPVQLSRIRLDLSRPQPASPRR